MEPDEIQWPSTAFIGCSALQCFDWLIREAIVQEIAKIREQHKQENPHLYEHRNQLELFYESYEGLIRASSLEEAESDPAGAYSLEPPEPQQTDRTDPT